MFFIMFLRFCFELQRIVKTLDFEVFLYGNCRISVLWAKGGEIFTQNKRNVSKKNQEKQINNCIESILRELIEFWGSANQFFFIVFLWLLFLSIFLGIMELSVYYYGLRRMYIWMKLKIHQHPNFKTFLSIFFFSMGETIFFFS